MKYRVTFEHASEGVKPQTQSLAGYASTCDELKELLFQAKRGAVITIEVV